MICATSIILFVIVYYGNKQFKINVEEKKIAEEKRIEEEKRKLDAQIERMKKANEPGYKPDESDNFNTTIEDGVIRYKKKRS